MGMKTIEHNHFFCILDSFLDFEQIYEYENNRKQRTTFFICEKLHIFAEFSDAQIDRPSLCRLDYIIASARFMVVLLLLFYYKSQLLLLFLFWSCVYITCPERHIETWTSCSLFILEVYARPDNGCDQFAKKMSCLPIWESESLFARFKRVYSTSCDALFV